MASDIENYDWLGLLKSVVDVSKNGPADDDLANSRWDHCKDCVFLTAKSQCTKCGCYMKGKVRVKGEKCPIGIW